jgi:alpha-glucosidase
MMTEHDAWWQTGIIYQIYPRSFLDSNHDGIGDLSGILHRLDYLQWLGMDAIWLSPINTSPMADFGYDVANYTDVDPIFGTLTDFTRLAQATHERGMKLLLDLVPNHTSDEHPWFVESRASRDNPRRDWYIWRDPAPDGGPPNNWWSRFGGPAWDYDAGTGQYYLHLFDPKQPDLNWRNPDVRAAMYDVMRFWLDRGVDGFRVDVIWMMIKDAQFRDNPENPDWTPSDPPWTKQEYRYSEDQPEVHEIIREMRQLVDSYGDRLLIGEIYLPVERLVHYYGTNLDETHMPFNFQLPLMPSWSAATTRDIIDAYEAAVPQGAWPNWVLGNHDIGRVASRIGARQAPVAQMLLLTLRGTPTCYYGDELGMQDVPIPQDIVQDPQGIRFPGYSRDPERTPMQWDASPHAGFSTVEPWLPVAANSTTRNVATQRDDPRSLLNLVRTLTHLRRDLPALQVGDYRSLDTGNDDIFAYVRSTPEQQLLVVLNFGADEQQLDLTTLSASGDLLCTTYLDQTGLRDLRQLTLRPDEGLLMRLR